MKKRGVPTGILLMVSLAPLLLGSCGRSAAVPPDAAVEPVPETAVSTAAFSVKEQQYLEGLRDRGYITAGAVLREGLLERRSDGSYTGIKYDLAAAFAEYLDVELRIRPLQFEEYFTKDGVLPEGLRTDAYLTYTPDIYDEVDFTADFMTLLPWRLKIMNMIPLLPSKEILVCRKGTAATGIRDLEGRRIGYVPETSFEDTLRNTLGQSGTDAELVPLSLDDDAYALVEQGVIDAFLEDSHRLFQRLKEHPDLYAGLPVSDLRHLSWTTARGDEELEGLINRFFAHARETGLLNDILLRFISVDLETYYSLIGFEGGQEIYELGLTAAERAWLDDIRRDGVLRIATLISEDNYLPRDDGTIIGFDYMLASSLADTLGLALEVTAFDSVAPFFALDGVFDPAVVTDPGIIYTPTLFQEVDLYCVPFSITEWRRKLVRFVQMYPVTISLAGRKGEEISDIVELDGKRVAVLPGSFQEGLMLQTMAEHDVEIELVYLEGTELPLEVVSVGRADFALDAAAPLIKGLTTFDNLVVSPVHVTKITNGWAVRKDNEIFASILEKYMARSLADGSFGAMWTRHFGIDFDEYMQFVAE